MAEPYGARGDWVEEFENVEDFSEVKRVPSPTNPFQRKSTIRVKMRRVDGETHVLCLSSERKEKGSSSPTPSILLDFCSKVCQFSPG